MKQMQAITHAIALFAVAATAMLAGLPAATAQETSEITDLEISDAVEDEFLFDQAVPLNEIDVETDNGVVTLEGTVDNILVKERAARIASTVRGVRSVVNNIEVSPPFDLSGDDLRRRVESALAADPATDSWEIGVSVIGNAVTLTGSVESWAEKQLAAQVAKGVKGVASLNNEIEVEYDVERTDAEIKNEIEERLDWDVRVDNALIDVQVDEGNVELSGTVGSLAEKNEAIADAWVSGVYSVDASDLEIDPWARDEDLRKDKFTQKSDAEIRDAVEDALLYDPRVYSFEITPTVEDGVVTLRGTVDNLQAKRAAASDARHTVGVVSVINRIKVRPGTPTDGEIEQSIEDAFINDPYLERYEMTVNVRNGKALIDGEVDSYFEKARAEDVAARIYGVTEVENNLDVDEVWDPYVYEPYLDDYYYYDFDWDTFEPGDTLLSDSEIKNAIESQFFWSPYIDGGDVVVTVEDGVATLTGEVDSWMERDAATENAYEGGAISVDNDLVIVN